MVRRLDGTVAMVTGASAGIGAATAHRLAAEGAAVALVARRGDLLDGLIANIVEKGGAAAAFEADVTDPRQVDEAVGRLVDRFGRLDTVVNNAGLMLVGPVADAPPDEWDRMIDLNLRGALNVTRSTIPLLVDAAATSSRGVADIVNISSTAGRVARAGTAVYNLTKFGLNAFSEALRQELQPQRVRVSLVEPGTVDTELRSHVRDDIRDGLDRQVAGMTMLSPDDIADAVAYVIGRPRHVAVNEILVRASEQTW
jgi:NADP-dependent 3-hydroxy acid dehydrogenase YdfG